jgi:hypothetical protein
MLAFLAAGGRSASRSEYNVSSTLERSPGTQQGPINARHLPHFSKNLHMDARKTNIVGGQNNFWLWSKESGYDITQLLSSDAPPIYPRITLATRGEPATLDLAKTVLVVTDMQNYFLSPHLDRPPDSLGYRLSGCAGA